MKLPGDLHVSCWRQKLGSCDGIGLPPVDKGIGGWSLKGSWGLSLRDTTPNREFRVRKAPIRNGLLAYYYLPPALATISPPTTTTVRRGAVRHYQCEYSWHKQSSCGAARPVLSRSYIQRPLSRPFSGTL